MKLDFLHVSLWGKKKACNLHKQRNVMCAAEEYRQIRISWFFFSGLLLLIVVFSFTRWSVSAAYCSISTDVAIFLLAGSNETDLSKSYKSCNWFWLSKRKPWVSAFFNYITTPTKALTKLYALPFCLFIYNNMVSMQFE